jgi:hypothetical protein
VELARGLETLLVAGVVAALAPLLVALLPGPRIPQVVILDWPDILREPPEVVLPAFVAGGTSLV